jgi:tRNA (cmo5U34)-methyltransferase
MHHDDAVERKFGAERATHYDAQAVAWFAGYQAMHEVIAATMAAALEGQEAPSVLCVGVGTGQDMLPYAQYGAPGWRFTGVDPSPHMLAVAEKRLAAAGLLERTRLHTGELHTLPPGPAFDGAEMIGVLHHVTGEEARLALLREVTRRLKPGAPFIIGCRVGMDPLLLAVEDQRFRVNGGTPEHLALRHQGMATLQPPESDAALFALLGRAGLESPRQLFASLQFKVFLTRC